mmetsp:Transcript_37533/g.106000  ORF Transcript_37533/g.106000 Transcript_37533/m.106000 type:complete len:736 (-) Transcript_37533:559-2766(-)
MNEEVHPQPMLEEGAPPETRESSIKMKLQLVTGASVQARVQHRQQWPSTRAFVFAAIGSAAGLSNIWRFPTLTYTHGGGAFLIPYFLCLLMIGAPLLLMELGLGRVFRAGDIDAFGGIHRRLRGIGISSMLASFSLSCSFVAVLSWAVVYFAGSFTYPLPWTAAAQGIPSEPCASPISGDQQAVDFAAESNFFYNKVLRLASKEQLEAAVCYVISGWVYGGTLVNCFLSFFCMWRGLGSVSRVVYFTVLSPVVILVVLFAYNMSLSGAVSGVMAYIGTWDLSVLKSPTVWVQAAGQVSLSLSLAAGTMTAYGSFADDQDDLVASHAIIAGANSAVSFLSGFVVFSVLGYIVYEEEQRCPNVLVDSHSVYGSQAIGLIFVVYAKGMGSLPAGLGNLMSALFYFTIVMLGVDSLFSMLVSFVTVVRDCTRFRQTPHELIAVVAVGCLFMGGSLFATDLGLYLIDCFNHYLVNYGILLVLVMESTAVGWIWGHEDCVQRVGQLSTWLYTIGYHMGYLIAVGISVGFAGSFEGNTSLAIGLSTGVGIYAVVTLAAFFTRGNKVITFVSFLRSVLFCGTEKLREELNWTARRTQLPPVWDVSIKYISPPVLLGLILVIAVKDCKSGGYLMPAEGDAPAEPYPMWLQMVSFLLLLSILLVCFVNLFLPSVWERAAGIVVLRSYEDNSSFPQERALAANHESSESEIEASNGEPHLKARSTTSVTRRPSRGAAFLDDEVPAI